MNNVSKRDNCRLCQSKNIDLVLDLGYSALANQFVDTNNIKQEEYPLRLYKCSECGHYQLLDIVNPDLLFKNYLYVSGTSQLMRDHFKDYAKEAIHFVKHNPFVVDIGGNDGTLLKEFQKLDCKILNIDPAENIKNEIETITKFFDIEVAKDIVEKYGHADCITCNNCFAHTDDLDKIVEGVKYLLKEDGIFIVEASNFDRVIETNDFSQLYHEHLSYHQTASLERFFNKHNMYISYSKDIDIHGGSTRWYIRNGMRATSYSSCQNTDNFLTFTTNISEMKTGIKEKLLKLKNSGKKLAGATASAKSTTFLHYCDIGTDIFDCIYDDAPEKQNKFSPGKHIPIKPFSAMYEDKPNYILLLSFNFIKSMMEKYKDYDGTWIVALPEYKEFK